jgi:hypothetical protein
MGVSFFRFCFSFLLNLRFAFLCAIEGAITAMRCQGRLPTTAAIVIRLLLSKTFDKQN